LGGAAALAGGSAGSFLTSFADPGAAAHAIVACQTPDQASSIASAMAQAYAGGKSRDLEFCWNPSGLASPFMNLRKSVHLVRRRIKATYVSRQQLVSKFIVFCCEAMGSNAPDHLFQDHILPGAHLHESERVK
jgi:hypothetical protein